MEGKGVWFDTPAEAKSYVAQHMARGARSFDVGCFQLNYRWHGEAFASVAEMFDPLENALYAARFLKELHGEFGNWTDAAGAYHSRTPKYAERYKSRFQDFVARLDAAPDLSRVAAAAPDTPAPPPAPNLYPFLKPAAAQTRMGSLVPGTGGGGAFIALPGVKG
ncbi:transglycosylase SLT domain-containing protein [Poseidonocella sedimentorum]|uniref:Transglycosylase SLT domain-containing protein n=1 Tax=Poseidonocella sedimentorum TaxID=871652 RepID=A0A1I6D5T6_9RHOB|nr:transglycosylase SLT domain-containing protein [Poseidonocella sedimentorum]SFR00721.1 Transglycosylase SLT domain-containing protein [Poseidonocella sedimentorum]